MRLEASLYLMTSIGLAIACGPQKINTRSAPAPEPDPRLTTPVAEEETEEPEATPEEEPEPNTEGETETESEEIDPTEVELEESPSLHDKLQGTWSGACHEEAGNQSSRATVAVIGDTMDLSLTYYRRPDCVEEHPSKLLVMPTTFAIVEYDGETEGGIDFTLGQASLVFFTKQSRRNQTCKPDKNWVKDEPQFVDGKICSGVKIPEQGTLSYDIIELKDGELRFGLNFHSNANNTNNEESPWTSYTEDSRPKNLADEAFSKTSETN